MAQDDEPQEVRSGCEVSPALDRFMRETHEAPAKPGLFARLTAILKGPVPR